MARIAVLSDELINKIAAGEVVERPASVVKELCENSIDARSTAIRVRLADGGLGLVEITDDGMGMSREDAQLSLVRHATSKLRDLDGLFSLLTKGFRGEAIPAIASVSRFTLTTCEAAAAVGTRLSCEGGQGLTVEDAAPVPGTQMRVEDLFFNTPARRKFLRRADTELRHCEEAVIRLALAHPEVAFTVEHQGSVLLSSPASPDLRERIAAALGTDVHPHLLEIDERRLGITVRGQIASPEFTFSNARGLYTFVNHRYVRDRGLNSAIQRAFQESLPPGRQPVAVIFIEVDPRAVDVNVHPQKMEVRFADGKGVYDAVHAAIQKVLRSAPWLSNGPESAPQPASPHYAMAVEQFLTRARQALGGPLPLASERTLDLGDPMALSGALATPGFGELQPGINEAPPEGFFASLRPLGVLAKRFWICEAPGGTLTVVDPHAAVERIRLTALRERFGAGAPAQPTLFTTTVELSPAEAKVIVGQLPALARLGFELEPFGGTTFAVKSVPPELSDGDVRATVKDLAVALPPKGAETGGEGESPAIATFAEAIRVVACRSADAALRRTMTEVEMRGILAQLDRADFLVRATHGNVVAQETPLLELERRAGTLKPG